MDELYGDLENYNEVNAVEELRNENKELKLKLQEYETAMGKLQKDYDNLALEFQNLQNNYSSLLKTARAEVERKTQMIAQLNIEKDMTVLQSLQNGNNRNLINNRTKLQKGFTIPKKTEKVEPNKSKFSKKVKNEIQKTPDLKNERSESDSAPKGISASKIIVPSADKSMLLNIVDKVVEKVDANIKKDEHKENVSLCKLTRLEDTHKDSSKSRARGISGRRKSMPAVSMPKFSSDEECEEDKLTKEIIRSEITERRNLNTTMTRLNKEKECEKNHETSSVDGRGVTNQEIAKEGYRSRTGGRHYESDKYRDSDKYRETDRLRDHDRLRDTDRGRVIDRHREIDKHRESDKYRDVEKYRGRDRYDSSHRHRKHYSPDRSHKRSNREYYDEYHRHEYGRHKVLESPPPESHRSQHYHRSQDYRSNYERHSNDSDKHKYRHQDTARHAGKHSIPSDFDEPSNKRQKLESEIHIYDSKIYHENDVSTRTSRTETQEYETLRTSCQSPDAVLTAELHPDTSLVHTIKEIRNTAAIPLEDPRLNSKKYILKSENGRTSLSTVASKNIDIKPIDKSVWNLEQVVIPDALMHKPQSKLTDENIKEIYMDIDYPDSNASIESGEICFDSEDTSPQNYKIRDESAQNHSLEKLPTQKLKPDSDFVLKNTSTCKNPQVYANNKNTQTKGLNESKDLPKITCDDHTNVNKVSRDKEHSIQQQPLLPQMVKHDKTLSSKIADEKTYKNNGKAQNQITVSDMAMVQDDLELSDETSDNVDLHRQCVNEKELVNKMPQIVETKNEVNTANLSPAIAPKQKAESDETNNSKPDKLNDPDCQKKAKSKRRKTKSIEKELIVTVGECHEKKTKYKKDKESKPKQIKTKFTDLFGDSSSLITPEDLGIPASCVPLCEDAVDINIKEIVNTSPSFVGAEVIGKDDDAYHDENTYNTNLGSTNTEEIAKRIEEQIKSPEVDANIVYQNLNSETSANKQDVVKTVIISSGVQPQFTVSNEKETAEKRIADVEVNIQNIVESHQPRSVMDLKKINNMKALATSTPQKEFTLTTMETDSRTASYISNSNDSKSESVNTTSQQDLSDTNTQESHDAPDVRIFVRRRRKGVRRT